MKIESWKLLCFEKFIISHFPLLVMHLVDARLHLQIAVIVHSV